MNMHTCMYTLSPIVVACKGSGIHNIMFMQLQATTLLRLCRNVSISTPMSYPDPCCGIYVITVQAGRRQLCTAWPHTTCCWNFSLFLNGNTCMLVVTLEGDMLPGKFMDIPNLCDGKMPAYTAIFGTPALTLLHVMGGIPLISACMGSAAVRLTHLHELTGSPWLSACMWERVKPVQCLPTHPKPIAESSQKNSVV